jgi:hypothetical protein
VPVAEKKIAPVLLVIASRRIARLGKGVLPGALGLSVHLAIRHQQRRGIR